MQTAYNILLTVAALVAVAMSLLIFVTGKGDAMGGGGGVRTTFKGKASFDDQMYKFTLSLGGAFFGLMVVLDIISSKI